MQHDTANAPDDADSLLAHPYFPGTAFLFVGGTAAAFGFRYGVKRANELASSDEANAQEPGAREARGRAAAAASRGVAATVTPAASSAGRGAGSDASRFVRPRAPAVAVQPARVAVRALLAGTALCACGAGGVVLGAGWLLGVDSLQGFSDKMKRDVPGLHKRVCERLGVPLPAPVEPMSPEEESRYLDGLLAGGDGGGDAAVSGSNRSAGGVSGANG